MTILPADAADGDPLQGYGPLIDGAGEVWDRNMVPNAQIYSARTARTIAKWTASDGQPLQPPPILQDVQQIISNQVPNDLDQGAASNASEIYTGNFTQLLIGVRPTLAVRVVKLDQAFADHMQTGLLAFLRADVALARPGAFTVSTGVVPEAA